MNLAGNQIKDSYGNLLTIGTVAGTPTTGTLQNGAGSDLTSITLNGAAVFNEGGADFDFRVEGLNDTNLLFVDASADRVGIGTNAPSVELDVDGAIGSTGNIITSAGFIRSSDGSAASPSIQPGVDGDTGFFRPTTNQIGISTGGTERLRIDSSGNVGIGTSTPAAKLHVVGGNIKVGDTYGIDFSDTAGTGTSELLDDYEEGTWTPVYEPTTGSFTSITMDVIQAKYTKIGDTVHLIGYIRTDAVDTTGASGALKITGLPFTPATTVATAACGAQLGWTTNIPTFADLTSAGIFLRRADGVGTVFASIDVTNMTNAADSNRVSFTITYEV